jgi:hypothetical protein
MACTGRRQRAGAQHNRQVARGVDVEVAAGDRGIARGDAVADERRRLDDAVEDDRELAADVGPGDAREVRAALGRHLHAHAPAAGVRLVQAHGRLGARHRAAGELRLLLEHVERAAGHARSRLVLVAPQQLGVGGDQRVDAGRREQPLHGRRVLLAEEAVVDHEPGERRSRQRRVRAGHDVARGEPAVEALEQDALLVVRAHELELEQRGLADQLLRALGVGEAGELHRDPILALDLDERLGDAELVDAVVDDLARALDRVLRLGRRESRLVHFEQELHTALEVEAQMDGPLPQLAQLRLIHRLPLGGRHRIEAEGGV